MVVAGTTMTMSHVIVEEEIQTFNPIECLKKQKTILESQGFTVAYICLYGSQNYGLDIHTDGYQSDIDMKAVVVPTLDDLVRNSKPISMVVDTEWGQCDIKDIRMYFQTLLKANPAYIETIYSKYHLIDWKFTKEFSEIFELRDELTYTLRTQFIRAMYGIMCEKEKALCHPYSTIAHKIEKFGYDGKQAHHVYRLWLMMQDYFKFGKSFTRCMEPPLHTMDKLYDLKLNKLPLDEVKSFVVDTMSNAKVFKDSYLLTVDESVIDYSIKYKFLMLSQDIIKNKIEDDIQWG